MGAPSHTINYGLETYRYAAAVTKSDATVLNATGALYVGGAGDLTVTMAADGADVVIEAVPVGTVLRISVTKVKAATTASKIVALW